MCTLSIGYAALSQAQTTEVVLHNFEYMPHGGNPESVVIGDNKGNFYGTTFAGGAANLGVVYVLNAAGQQKVLHSFTGGTDGANPVAGVIRDDQGNLYGTTSAGGAANQGTVYKVDPGGAEKVLYAFTGGADGGYPVAGLTGDSGGNLYGVTSSGGAMYSGTVFKVDGSGKETVLYSFGGGANGLQPRSSLAIDTAGNLYGTTDTGGMGYCSANEGCGLVYKVDPAGQETVLYSFTGMTDGGIACGAVTLDGAGDLYGGTCEGGANNSGTVYKLAPGGELTVLYNIPPLPSGVYWSVPSALVSDPAGNFYFTTQSGGQFGYGVLYELDAAGKVTVLHNFGTSFKDGLNPNGVIRDSSGNLYGTTAYGGAPGCSEYKVNCGTVFQVDAAGRESVIYNFPGAARGQEPYAGVVMDAAGNLYGTTVNGGAAIAGVVYKLDTTGRETVLYTFTGGADGAAPYGGVILDAAGNLYGTTTNGGIKGHGVVFKLAAPGQFMILHTFTGGADGGFPYGALVLDAGGNLYGTTESGGIVACNKPSGGPLFGCGVVYKIDAQGTQTVLYSFAGGSDGSVPKAGVILDENGNLYGTTFSGGTAGWGTVFKLTPAGEKTVLHNFAGAPDGVGPLGSLARDSSGNLYGTTAWGGSYNFGSVCKVSAAGMETVLYFFRGERPRGGGGDPQGGVILDSAGNLYGTTPDGDLCGLVYKLSATGARTTLYNFTCGADGGSPNSNLILTAAGDLIGTAVDDGKMGGGVVFAIKAAAAAR